MVRIQNTGMIMKTTTPLIIPMVLSSFRYEFGEFIIAAGNSPRLANTPMNANKWPNARTRNMTAENL